MVFLSLVRKQLYLRADEPLVLSRSPRIPELPQILRPYPIADR